MAESPDDPYRVDPAEHRGREAGILARLFQLARRRRPEDHRGPAPLPPEPGSEPDDDEERER
jgi:hypothetical protein